MSAKIWRFCLEQDNVCLMAACFFVFCVFFHYGLMRVCHHILLWCKSCNPSCYEEMNDVTKIDLKLKVGNCQFQSFWFQVVDRKSY
jgi:hypothetical protein